MGKFDEMPCVVDVNPKEMLEILYSSGATADLGNELAPKEVKDVPMVRWPSINQNLYTLCMIDPDVPSHSTPKLEVLHWLVVNIPGNKIEKGDVIVEYHGSGPLLGSGLHNYVFLVFEQIERIQDEDTQALKLFREERTHFSVKKFAKKYNLGAPIAGNYFQAQYDDYVPVLHNTSTH